MNWKVKAAIHRACAALPIGKNVVHYSLQRAFGLLGDPQQPLMMLDAAALLLTDLRERGFDLHGKRVMEVGTGWRVDMPIAFYLCGATSIVTYDIRRHLKPGLVMSALAAFARERATIARTFQALADPVDVDRRLTTLAGAGTIRDVFQIAGIEYHAPADATRTGLPPGSVDLHVSYTVLQHVPYDTIVAMLREATRVLAPGGLACHHVDLSDQFARADASISRAHFLRYSDAEWARYAGNDFAWHNRLRARDYERAYREAGHEIVGWVTHVDERSRREIAAGFPLAELFRGQLPEMLAVDTVRAISRPAA